MTSNLRVISQSLKNLRPVFDRRRLAFAKRWLIPPAFFVLALVVRLPALDSFLTPDEPLWVDRSRAFVSGILFDDYECGPVPRGRDFNARRWGCTLQTPHPGVTTMWAGSLGLFVHYWQAVRPNGAGLRTFLESIRTDPLDPALIAPVRLPFPVVAALFVGCFYWLLRRLLTARIALVATLLVALQPFHIALSRVIHHDALNTTFMVLSLLAMSGYWLQGWRWYWLAVSAVMAGLAVLSKAVGFLMIPYVVALGTLSLYYRRRGGRWRGRWSEVWRLAGEWALWAGLAGLTFVAFFPAMWVIPDKAIDFLIRGGTELVEAGHTQYFLGRVSTDPGPLYYPVGWLLRASPLEVLGLLALLGAVWRVCRMKPLAHLGRLMANRPVETALLLFLAMFLLFETASPKKIERYFLPAFPVIDVFVAFGLLWPLDTLARLGHRRPAFRRAGPLVAGILLLVQGWLVVDHYPHYFAYYNPLLGSAPGAARLITIGWGEGMKEAATYLNQLPGPESLRVASCKFTGTLRPFLAGEAYCIRPEIVETDYVVYYYSEWQLQEKSSAYRYLSQHYQPVYRVSLHGLDYVLVYRNPIEHQVDLQENSLPNVLTTFGYNLPPEGTLTLFWQNHGPGEPPKLLVGLAPLTGGEAFWAACQPAPSFTGIYPPDSIMESRCPLAGAGAPPGLYDLFLGLSSSNDISPLQSSALTLVSIEDGNHFEPVDLANVLGLSKAQELPDDATPLEISFIDVTRLVGYQLAPATWRAGSQVELVLYWQPIRRVDFAGLANIIQVVLQLTSSGGSEPLLSASRPILPPSVTTRNLARGAIVPVHYPLSLPATLQPGEYRLKVCLATTGGQPITGKVIDTSEAIDCLPLSVVVGG